MHDLFILRGRQMIREAIAAWVSLAVGSLIFGCLFVRLSPNMGRDAALVASFVASVPVACFALLKLRDVRHPADQPVIAEQDPEREPEIGWDFGGSWRTWTLDERKGLLDLAKLMGGGMLEPYLLESVRKEKPLAEEIRKIEISQADIFPLPADIEEEWVGRMVEQMSYRVNGSRLSHSVKKTGEGEYLVLFEGKQRKEMRLEFDRNKKSISVTGRILKG